MAGGPVGLVAATALAAADIPVTVVEESVDVTDDLRASTFHPPTLDFLDKFGVTQSLIAQGLICPLWQFRDHARAQSQHSTCRPWPARRPFRIGCSASSGN